MKLKSDCTFWPQVYQGPECRFIQLDRDTSSDFVIVGGGISGALIGYHLIRAGMDVALIERSRVGHGSTSASTGLLQYEIDTSLIELTHRLGKERAAAAYRASLESTLAFGPLVEELGDDCGLIPRRSFYLASEQKDMELLRAECEARRALGIDVSFLNSDALKSEFQLDRPAALWSRDAFEVDPFRLTLSLIRRAHDRGLRAFEDTGVDQVISDPESVTIKTSTGARIVARKIIIATGYGAIHRLPSDLSMLSSTYALVSEPIADFRNWPQRCLIWESARPYFYMRTTVDGRVMIGGADEEIVEPRHRDKLIDRKAADLCEQFARLFPAITITRDCAWAGTFAETKDGLPLIGEMPQFPHRLFALGYGGNGITFSLLAANLMIDLPSGKENERIALFGFNR